MVRRLLNFQSLVNVSTKIGMKASLIKNKNLLMSRKIRMDFQFFY